MKLFFGDKKKKGISKLSDDQLDGISAGAYTPGAFKEEANGFLKSCLGDEMYDRIMSNGNSRKHPYVAAKIYLSGQDWEKFVWIEQHGSLDGFTD